MKGAVNAVLESQPRAPKLSALAGRTLVGEVLLTRGQNQSLRIVSVVSKSEALAVQSIEEQVPGSDYIVHLSATAATDPSTEVVDLEVTAEVHDGSQRIVRVPITLDHLHRVTLHPAGPLTFSTGTAQPPKAADKKAPQTCELTLVASEPSIHFEVLGVEITGLDPELFQVDRATLEEDQRYSIKVTLNDPPKSPARGKISVRTNDPERPLLERSIIVSPAGSLQRKSPRKNKRAKGKTSSGGL